MKSASIMELIREKGECSIRRAELLTQALHREKKLSEDQAIRFRPLFGDFDIVNADLFKTGIFRPGLCESNAYSIEQLIARFGEQTKVQDIGSNAKDNKGIANVEVFYTGGGIWLAAKYIADHVYAIVDSDFDECITYYDDRDEDEKFACQNMVESIGIDEMGVADHSIWEELHTALSNVLI